MQRILALLALMITLPGQALAWGGTGHRMIGEIAAESLPPALPAFLRTRAAALELGEQSREPDRWKGAGKVHDQGRDPAHFVDLNDDGTILGGPRLAALPATRADYETALRAAGVDGWKAGWLPYAMVDAAQQVTKDFGYWRVLAYAERHEKNPARRAWLVSDRKRREALIFANLGVLSHYVADGSQPLHVTVHYNGWSSPLNPNGFTTSKIHGPFESDFVEAFVDRAMIRGALPPPRACACSLEQRTADYLTVTGGQVTPFYALEKAGGLQPEDPRGKAFATERLAAGAAELRDLIVRAWDDSAAITVGWTPVSVADVLAGKVDPYPALYGKD